MVGVDSTTRHEQEKSEENAKLVEEAVATKTDIELLNEKIEQREREYREQSKQLRQQCVSPSNPCGIPPVCEVECTAATTTSAMRI